MTRERMCENDCRGKKAMTKGRKVHKKNFRAFENPLLHTLHT